MWKTGAQRPGQLLLGVHSHTAACPLPHSIPLTLCCEAEPAGVAARLTGSLDKVPCEQSLRAQDPLSLGRPPVNVGLGSRPGEPGRAGRQRRERGWPGLPISFWHLGGWPAQSGAHPPLGLTRQPGGGTSSMSTRPSFPPLLEPPWATHAPFRERVLCRLKPPLPVRQAGPRTSSLRGAASVRRLRVFRSICRES